MYMQSCPGATRPRDALACGPLSGKGENPQADNELLYLRDAYLREFDAAVVDASDDAVALVATAFYPTGGGQPHDTGTLAGVPVTDVRKEGDLVWHTLDGPIPRIGETVHGELDWDRRFALMRTHTALHILCGVIWNE